MQQTTGTQRFEPFVVASQGCDEISHASFPAIIHKDTARFDWRRPLGPDVWMASPLAMMHGLVEIISNLFFHPPSYCSNWGLVCIALSSEWTLLRPLHTISTFSGHLTMKYFFFFLHTSSEGDQPGPKG